VQRPRVGCRAHDRRGRELTRRITWHIVGAGGISGIAIADSIAAMGMLHTMMTASTATDLPGDFRSEGVVVGAAGIATSVEAMVTMIAPHP